MGKYCISFDGNHLEQRIYTNGILIDKGISNNSLKITTGFNIGKDFEKNIQYFYGKIDDLRIYNRALSEEEIKALYEKKGVVGYKNTYKIPDYSQTYIFDIDGKHLKTLDSTTEKVLTTFEYDEKDRLHRH